MTKTSHVGAPPKFLTCFSRKLLTWSLTGVLTKKIFDDFQSLPSIGSPKLLLFLKWCFICFWINTILILFCVHVGLQLAPIPHFGSDEVTQKLPTDTNIIFEFYIGLSIVVGTAVTNCLHRSLGIWLIRHDVFVSTRVNRQPFLLGVGVDITLSCNLIYLEQKFALSFTQLKSQPVQGGVDLGRVGFLGLRMGYQDTRILYPACWCFQNSCGCTSFSLLYIVYYATSSSDNSFFYIAQVAFVGFL